MGVELDELVIQAFLGGSDDYSVAPLGSGLIHQTLLVKAAGEEYVFQRLNDHVFPNLRQVMENIEKVTAALRSKEAPTLEFLKKQGENDYLCSDSQGKVWRCSRHIPGSTTFDTPPTPVHLKNAARAFAGFAKCLSNGTPLALHPTIEGFHDTPKRYERMEKSWDSASDERQSLADYYALRHAKNGFPEFGLGGLLAPHVPQTVSHNDTKLNNCLFKKDSSEVLCVIDLDTVMEGSWLMDFGDLCRTAICSQPEDTTDLDQIEVDLERFQALAEGYAEVFGEQINEEEKKRMVYSVFLLTYELALRFFTDYLQEDHYFGAKYPEHNLDRARSQLTLALKVAAARKEMEEIVANAFCAAV